MGSKYVGARWGSRPLESISQESSMVESYRWWRPSCGKFKSILFRHDVEYKMTWSNSKNGKFFVKDLYSFLALGGSKAFPTRVV